ncbi:hypothetical protein K2173_000472 [Erythroxylum novogranatense]|uniref:non-specific serine/threonine protein kinase n=1 Tax=Erythroxylum novogranatense TaxID=1862640 RepID=A0AAV8SWC3_9ROSI|nr:hypothetical protein K2173_000472 [Erythroxylum novogranatense]
MADKLPVATWFLMLFFVSTYHFATSSQGLTEAEILTNFRKSLYDDSSSLSSWNVTVNPIPCSNNTAKWVGVRCNKDGTVFKLLLPNMGLKGTIDIDMLVLLKSMRTLNLMNNRFEGPLPQVKKLAVLKNLYLSYNGFSGEIPDDTFAGMNALKELYLGHNQFSGEIPSSLVDLKNLMKLNLESNQFTGRIPDFGHGFLEFNVASNRLNGAIPRSLRDQNARSFKGNEGLCGYPLPPCKTSSKKKIIVIGVLVGSAAVLVGLALFTFIRKRNPGTPIFKDAQEAKTQKTNFAVQGVGKKMVESPEHNKPGNKRTENGKLHFVRNDRDTFELHDLLRASAEVLGSGSFGSSYKAVLHSGPAMVVKRFRHMHHVGKEEFYEHMRKLGRLSHPNLLPLVAFYYRKEEKFLVSDFVRNGSLATLLHAKRAPGVQALDWSTRVKIIKGVAKGLAYLYKEFPNVTLPHGHLKSSNVLLGNKLEPLLTDYALVPILNKDHAQQVTVAYKSPEFIKAERTTRKTDVWSLGILILEILTGKFPANYLKQGRGANADLAAWVNSVVREEWTGEVFDKDMKGPRNGEGEMLKLLKIGMCCCEWNLERRWDLRDAIDKIEELKERESDADYSSSYASEGDHEVNSSRAPTDDDFSFSVTG